MTYAFIGYGADAPGGAGSPVDLGVEVRGNLRYVPAALQSMAVVMLGTQMHGSATYAAPGTAFPLIPGPPPSSPPGMDPNWVQAQLNAGNAVLMTATGTAGGLGLISKSSVDIARSANAATGAFVIVVIPPLLDAYAQKLAAPLPAPQPQPQPPDVPPQPVQEASMTGGGLPSWALPVGLAAVGGIGLWFLLK